MEEFKDACQGLIVQCDEIAEDMRHLPTDYNLLSNIQLSTRKFTICWSGTNKYAVNENTWMEKCHVLNTN